MKFNWRVLVAIALMIGAAYWVVDSVRPRSYSGENLRFGVGSGPVTVTNPSDEAIAVQLVGTGRTSYSVSTSIEEVSGSSTREGTGRNLTHLFSFMLPPGVSEFTVARGDNVSFVADTSSTLEATVQPQGASEARTTLIIGAVVILASLYYLSRLNEHRWISTLTGRKPVEQAAKPLADPAAHGQGRAIRAYGDNRADN